MTTYTTRRRFLLRTAGLTCGIGLSSRSRANPTDDVPVGTTPATDRAVTEGLAFLAARQMPDGSFGSRFYRGNVAVTSLTGLAFLAGGHHIGRSQYGPRVEGALGYLLGQQAEPTGLLHHAAESEQARMYSHGFGTLFLAEAYGMIPDRPQQERTRRCLDRAVRATVAAQNGEGGWRYTPRPNLADVSVTICQIMALRAARNAGLFVPKGAVDACVEFVKNCRTPDGGFSYFKGQGPSAFARTAAGVVALYSAGIYDGPIIRRALDYLMRFKPGTGEFGRMIPPDHYFYGHYYATLAAWTAGGQYWADWFPAISNELLRHPSLRQDGSWDDFRCCPEYATAMACVILQIPKNYLPIMQK